MEAYGKKYAKRKAKVRRKKRQGSPTLIAKPLLGQDRKFVGFVTCPSLSRTGCGGRQGDPCRRISFGDTAILGSIHCATNIWIIHRTPSAWIWIFMRSCPEMIKIHAYMCIYSQKARQPWGWRITKGNLPPGWKGAASGELCAGFIEEDSFIHHGCTKPGLPAAPPTPSPTLPKPVTSSSAHAIA